MNADFGAVEEFHVSLSREEGIVEGGDVECMDEKAVAVSDEVEGALAASWKLSCAIAKENCFAMVSGWKWLVGGEEVPMGGHVESGAAVDNEGDGGVGGGVCSGGVVALCQDGSLGRRRTTRRR